MSSTNEGVAWMTPAQERRFYEMADSIQKVAGEVSSLHDVLYKNGFQQRLKRIEEYISNADSKHQAACPVAPALRAHVEEIAEADRKRVRRKMRKTDVLLILFGLLLTLGAVIPSWLNLLMRVG